MWLARIKEERMGEMVRVSPKEKANERATVEKGKKFEFYFIPYIEITAKKTPDILDVNPLTFDL